MNSKINHHVIFQDLGVKDYQSAWDYQEKLLKDNLDIKVKNRELQPEETQETANHLLFVEHPHVYTLGKSGHEENMLANNAMLKEIDATYVKTNRGGDITYHGYGQIVGYPVLDLENFYTDIHKYMRDLEEIIIRTIAEYGLKGERSAGETGVWLDVGKPYARKICAMGVKASRWVTIHGFALNVNTDLRYFEYIIPCGIKDKQVTSLKRELEKDVDMEEVKGKIKKHFKDIFQVEWV
ncbi:lipoyl(octanoyl) transferase [Elizabethkingia meningoseptica]|uniref:lipoyl(octanoyl) transferase LipB n=1 Tax=Elizabethkingia meningoseptica TaxID=238 RepID=UPI000935F73D|nr:lipoyl(octanoyl) transferase LipB [Elizabethkingia meningoseptica]MCL1675200.1 lipoyl(octanoyl) transferase LipB [Elizabethkingia meningoseptica]MCL1685432.1 lipoyl(octanoyl) transferase LipB [Elizabethkingia meningoseptica]MDE5429390.1 lipoyl(octanoyl) transferase LipB [Elizabethkingia meningoseptica]MDE5487259.1 lipoyl(octanoyl) transferase LipB [Elizabethkingia meningoseptica]MDE5492209.1 lipoyl(octanoyl) transferase LipB [Elizabethkingia meningoseptica]